MFGFTIAKNITPFQKSERIIAYGDYLCENNMIGKFNEDKVFAETDDYIVIIDGVLLNLKELKGNKSLADMIISLYETYGEVFFEKLRGCFSGALYIKKEDTWIIFSDQLGQKYLFYYLKNNKMICSSMIDNVYQYLRDNKIEYKLDENGALMLLTFGFLLEDYTLCEDIKKIQPGHYLVFKDGKIQEKEYYILTNEPSYSRKEEDTLEEMDVLFRQAVTRQFEKDLEYGYNHIVALSAGLDSRMTSFVAHDLGYTKQLNITFSQSDYWDEFIPKRMASFLHHDWVYKSLDSGNWLFDVEKITKVTGGNVWYQGSAHGDSLFRLLDFSEYGMIHSGQMGDVVIGSKSKSNNQPYEVGYGSTYKTHIEEFKKSCKLKNTYPNQEIGLWYCRCLNGTNYGQQNEYNYTETFSPFTDLDLLSYCLTIPCEQRHNHRLYKKWIINKYPDAALFEWETIGAKITAPTITLKGKDYVVTSIPGKVLNKMGLKKSLNNSMNPIGFYLQNNIELGRFINSYFEYIDLIQSKKIKDLIIEIKNKGNAAEKLQAVSLLSAIKMYF